MKCLSRQRAPITVSTAAQPAAHRAESSYDAGALDHTEDGTGEFLQGPQSSASSAVEYSGPYTDEDMYDPAISREASLEEYDQLRGRIQARTIRFGLGVSGYIALTGTAQASLCCLGGLAAGLVYFNLLRQQVESMNPGQPLPVRSAQDINMQPIKAIALGLAAYSYAIRPRLVIPAALAAGVYSWNHLGLEPQLGWGDDIALIVGFLSFKAALLLQLWDDTKPRVKTLAELRAAKRPVIEFFELDDTPFDLSKRAGR